MDIGSENRLYSELISWVLERKGRSQCREDKGDRNAGKIRAIAFPRTLNLDIIENKQKLLQPSLCLLIAMY